MWRWLTASEQPVDALLRAHPPDVRPQDASLDGLYLQIHAPPTTLHRQLRRGAVWALGLTGLTVFLILALEGPLWLLTIPPNVPGEYALMGVVIAIITGFSTYQHIWDWAGRVSQPPVWHIRLRTLSLTLASEQHLHDFRTIGLADIAAVSPRSIRLHSGERLPLAPGHRWIARRWLAQLLLAAKKRCQGSPEDVPPALAHLRTPSGRMQQT